jgi:hypothetical protein
MGAFRHIAFLLLLNTRGLWRLAFKVLVIVLAVVVAFGPLLASRLGLIDMSAYSHAEVVRTGWMIRIAAGALVLALWALQWQYDVIVRRLAPPGHGLFLRQ